MKRIAIASILALTALTTSAGAYDRTNQIDRREARQEARIEAGRRSGEITRFEAMKLEAEQARIRQMERTAKADGHIDRREAARIREAQNEASRHIRQESHDGDRRRRWW